MKKIIIINGSPNKEGHTNKIVDSILEDININVEIKYINCYDININPCIDCKYCSKVYTRM